MMATTTVSSSNGLPDPSKSAKYSVQLSSALQDDRTPDPRFYTTRFNHKPSQTSQQRSTTISKSSAGHGAFDLVIQDEDGEGAVSKCGYSGQKSSNQLQSPYLLSFDQGHQTFTLDPISAAYGFNLTSAPWESDTASLAQEHRQIEFERDGSPERGIMKKDGGLFGEHRSGPDDSNPFDFRHYVSGLPPALDQPKHSSALSNAGTPRQLPTKPVTAVAGSPAHASARSSPPAKALPSNRDKPALKDRPAPRPTREKAAPLRKKQAQPVPKVRIERRASTRPKPDAVSSAEVTKKNDAAPTNNSMNADDDDDEYGDDSYDPLIIEGDDEESPVQARHPAFRDTPIGGGPVSLSSIARSTSPASHNATPNAGTAAQRYEMQDDESDDDVGSLRLGTPRIDADSSRRTASGGPSSHLEIPAQGDDDYESDFDAALQNAMDEEGDAEDDGGLEAEMAKPLESESESEEE